MAKRARKTKGEVMATGINELEVPECWSWKVTIDGDRRYIAVLKHIRALYGRMATRIRELDGAADSHARRYAILAQFAGRVVGIVDGLLIEPEPEKDQSSTVVEKTESGKGVAI